MRGSPQHWSERSHPIESFYQTDDDAQNALNNLYQSFCLNIAGNEGIYVALPVLFNEPGDDMLAAGNYYGDNDFGAQLNEFRLDSQNEVVKMPTGDFTV